LVKVHKRSGELEEFDMSKLEASMIKAGAGQEEATRIAATVAGSVTEGADTAQLMLRAATELRRIDPEAAERYETYKGSAYSFCPRCGRSMDADLESNSSACTRCGTVVQLPSRSTSVPAFSRTDSSKQQYSICMRCGAQIRGNAKLCKNCYSSRPHEITTIY
jgi:ribosomal protein L40E